MAEGEESINLYTKNMKNKRLILNWMLCLLPFCTIHAQDTHWQCDIRNFQYDMTLYAALQIDGTMLDASADYEIAAFYGDECRGVASVETLESTGKTYYYLRIRSNVSDSETITFKCYDKAKQCELVLDTTADFESQGIKGYPSTPFILTGAYTYKIDYVVDGEVVASDSVKCGTAITLPEEPTKEGHTFSGWSEVPETMPAEDVTISGTFTVNKYLVNFKIGDEVIASDSLDYGASIVAPEAPEKEGYTFDGWGEVAETVPAYDLTYTGSYSVNSYLLTFTVDGETVQTDSVAYGTAITLPEEPTKEGHTFSGWSDTPETMPAEDVIVSGIFTVNKYLVTFKIGDEVIASDSLDYGASIVAPEAPEKEGHTFNGWGEVAETVPAHDLTYMGSYSVNSYLLTFTVDGETVQTDSVAYGTAITLPEEPTKEGHTFSGWSDTPETMPAEDVIVSGIFTVNKYLVTFKIGDEVIASDSLDYGASIVAPEAPEKEGHTFNGWGEVAETVPAHDLTYMGSYSVNSYLLTFTVDGETVQTDSVTYGTAITLPEEPTKEGHTFSGWSKTPETMPAHDVTVSGTFSVNQYTVTYIIDGEVFATYTINYGENITMPDVPEREGYDFAWTDEIPETMPAKDIVINGAYTPISSIADITNANEVLYIYTINGQRVNELQEGLNIVLMKDGNIRKVLVK